MKEWYCKRSRESQEIPEVISGEDFHVVTKGVSVYEMESAKRMKFWEEEEFARLKVWSDREK